MSLSRSSVRPDAENQHFYGSQAEIPHSVLHSSTEAGQNPGKQSPSAGLRRHGALDALTRDHLNEELLKIWQKTKKTVIFVTHSIEEATFLSDRVLVMSARPGRVKEMVEIDLPRPRGEATRNDPKFTEYNKYLRGIIG